MASSPVYGALQHQEHNQVESQMLPPRNDTDFGRHRCSQCPCSFVRLEHLKRHEREHWEDKPFVCHLCGKSFTRSDTLKRHEDVHSSMSANSLSTPDVYHTRSRRGPRVRACVNCAQARARCSGENTCSRCSSRNLCCEYPEKRRRVAETTRPISGQIQPWNETLNPLDMVQPDLMEYQISPTAATSDISGLNVPMDPTYDSNMLSINWLPTSFTNDFEFNTFPAFGTPFPISNFRGSYTGVAEEQNDTIASLGTGTIPTPILEGQYSSPQEIISNQSSLRSNGRYYATSIDGARDACTAYGKRRPTRNIKSVHLHVAATTEPTTLFFPEVYLPPEDPIRSAASTMDISLEAYSQIASAFVLVCHGPTMPFTPFSTQHLPPHGHFNQFVELYFENFHPIFSILHQPTLELSEEKWLLALAIAAIGCRYSEVEEFTNSAAPMIEFLRRTLLVETEQHATIPTPLPVLQATVLCHIGMVYSGSHRLLDTVWSSHSRLVEAIKAGITSVEASHAAPVRTEWIGIESRNRLAYSIWLLDCMIGYHFDKRPSLSIEDMQVHMPCNEDLWNAPTIRWQELIHRSEANPPLSDAIHQLYVQKRVKADIGEFSRIILIHGIFQETWAIARYQRRPLAAWIPSAEKPTPEDQVTERTPCTPDCGLYLPENPLYSKWRNAACDCLDVLHWAANATIAQLAGGEHPTVLHLHISRVILLAPFSEISQLATSLASWADATTPETRNFPQVNRLQSKIIQWAQNDQHKARLAMIHAGALYWHVRRFSKTAFYEPKAVYLATLAMWAYGSYTTLTTKVLSQNGDRSGSTSPCPDGVSPSMSTASTLSEDPTFIRLDRPNDDEMVQLYVRNGHPSRMKAHVTSVGYLVSIQGPERVLREGCRILTDFALTWGVAQEYIRTLSKLADVVSKVGEKGFPT